MVKKKTRATEIKLDLACGANKREGFTGVDAYSLDGVDVVHDLRVTPWPWGDGSVAEVNCSHFLEHLSGSERVAFMNELHRILAPGAQATIITPYWNNMRAVQDPSHQWPPVSEGSYLYFNANWRKANGLEHYLGLTCNFDFSYGYSISGEWANRNEEARAFAVRHYMNVVDDLHVTLTKV